MMRRIIIIGAGQAGRRCAEMIRELDAAAEIMVFGAEAHLPYDRPPLSKSVLLGHETKVSLFVRDAAFYAQQRITLHLAEAVTCLRPAEKRIETEKGQTFHYDVLVLATGARARRLALPGADDPRILTLRNLDDGIALKQALVHKPRLAVIGGGLIGLEVAASALQMGASVHVLETGDRLMARSVPTAISHRMAALHRRHGVMLHFNAQVSAIAAFERELLLHTDTERLATDLVVVGIGGIAETSLAEAAGLAVADGILTDASGRTSHPDIYAAGEVARFAQRFYGSAPLRQETWQVAQLQPLAVARAICGQEKAYDEVPWHWTDQFDWNVQILGTPTEQLYQIERQEGERLTLLALDDGGALRGAVLINNGRDATPCRRLIASGKALDAEALTDTALPLRSFL